MFRGIRGRGLRRRSILLAALLLGGLALPAGALEVYDFDVAHSGPSFAVKHLFTMVHGRFSDFKGVLQYDPQKPEASTVEVTIQAASISTENDRRDAHLRSGDFFDTEKFPTITFKSTKIEPAKERNHFNVTGDLTIRGVTKPVVLDVEALGFGNTDMGFRGGFNVTATINRLDYGVSWNKTLETGGLLLGNDVKIDFPVAVVRRTE